MQYHERIPSDRVLGKVDAAQQKTKYAQDPHGTCELLLPIRAFPEHWQEYPWECRNSPAKSVPYSYWDVVRNPLIHFFLQKKSVDMKGLHRVAWKMEFLMTLEKGTEGNLNERVYQRRGRRSSV